MPGSTMAGEIAPAMIADSGPSASAAAQPETSEKWTRETILSVRRWAPTLFSFRTSRYRGFRFAPGQFARLGVAREDGSIVWRAYSVASAAYEEHLEFLSVVVPDGEFTGRLTRFAPGDRILVDKTSYGFLTTDRFPDGSDLWLLSSGTGLAPFLSILRDPAVGERYQRLVLVNSVRHAAELAFREEIVGLERNELFAATRARLRYLPVVTREACPGALAARITQAIADGSLEAAAGARLDPERSRLMICGNPAMALELRELLGQRGFRVGRRGVPGQLAFENYW